MNKKTKTRFGNYTNSVRTSGEVTAVFIREIEVICKLVLFIGANIQLFNCIFQFIF